MLIAEKHLKPGDKLPPIRKLAADLGVNPGTVAKAYNILTLRGYITTRGSAGSYVSNNACDLIRKNKREIVENDISVCIEKAKKIGITFDELLETIKEMWKDDGR